MNGNSLGARFIRWALQAPAVEGLVQIGSRLRSPGSAGAADEYSDWDFQVITSEPHRFDEAVWLGPVAVGPIHHWVTRGGRLGSARKLSIVAADGELDLVLIPLNQLQGIRELLPANRFRENPAATRALSDLALVLQGGHRVLKGTPEITEVYDFAARTFPLPRLTDAEVIELAAGFVADYVSMKRKLARGELLSAQRWLHHQLAETNFRLLHELRLRRGDVSFPDARRIEQFADQTEVTLVRISAALDRDALRRAAEESATCCRTLLRALVGAAWEWPDLPSGLRTE